MNVLTMLCVIYYVTLILLHSCLIRMTFGMKRDSHGSTTLLGDFSPPIFLVVPDSMDLQIGGDRSSMRLCPYEEADYVAELYFVMHQLHEKLWASIL